jgi:hypothetical protein
MSQRTKCQIGVTGTGAVLGGIGGGFGTSEIEKEPVDDGELAAGAAAGLVTGALIGWGLSYLLCHEEEAPPPPAPPPAPAPRAPAPPQTERRGG